MMTLLIVDDHAGMRALIRRVVASITSQVFECSDGEAALTAYTAHRPDVVLMDIAMPGMDGLTATRRVCAIDPAACVVIVTDYDGADLREQARQAGACAYVLKDRLLEVRTVLEETQRH